MSYAKNTWNTGDVITAAKLNNMENGIEAASRGGGGGSESLPEYCAEYEGLALVVKTCNGEPELDWGLPLPEIDSQHDAGKVLAISTSGTNGMIWKSEALPDYCHTNSDDLGKILTVVEVSSGYIYGAAWEPLSDELPNYCHDQYSNPDSGKALVVGDYGSLSWEHLLPIPNGNDEGKMMIANSTGEPVWGPVFPTFDTQGSDEGKALVVDEYGELAWETVGSGGGGGSAVPGVCNPGDILVSLGCGNGMEWKPLIPVLSGTELSDNQGRALVVGYCGYELGYLIPSFDTSDDGKVLIVTTCDGEAVLAWCGNA